jgi:hypothetical protein
MKTNASSNASFQNLKPFVDFSRLGDFFFDIFELFDLAVRMGLCHINNRSPVLATASILRSCNGAPHREQANS